MTLESRLTRAGKASSWRKCLCELNVAGLESCCHPGLPGRVIRDVWMASGLGPTAEAAHRNPPDEPGNWVPLSLCSQQATAHPAQPKVLHRAQGEQGCHSSDISLAIHTSGFKLPQRLQKEPSWQRSHQGGRSTHKCWFVMADANTWSLTVP